MCECYDSAASVVDTGDTYAADNVMMLSSSGRGDFIGILTTG